MLTESASLINSFYYNFMRELEKVPTFLAINLVEEVLIKTYIVLPPVPEVRILIQSTSLPKMEMFAKVRPITCQCCHYFSVIL